MHTATVTVPARGAKPALARLLALACAVAVVLVAPLARAAAPMCGAEGVSVAAPPPVFPIDAGRALAAPHCGKSTATDFVASAPPAERAPVAATATMPDRVLPGSQGAIVRARSGLLGITLPQDPARRPGFRSAVFRPPRAS